MSSVPPAAPTSSTPRDPDGGRRTPRSRWLGLSLVTLLSGLLGGPATLHAQTLEQVTETPDSTAALFLRSVRAIRWGTAAQFLHPTTLERFKTTARMMAAADTSGSVSTYLVEVDSTAIAGLAPAEVFTRSVGRVIDDMPGLMHSLYDRDDEVLGHVREGADTAHVVYRTTARISGAVPEMKVMELARASAGGWRVAWSDELEVLEAALRGSAR